MTEAIKQAAAILRQATPQNDYEQIGLITAKEAAEDYLWFIHNLENYGVTINNVRTILIREYNKLIAKQNTAVNCTTHLCDFCKQLCAKFDEGVDVNGCFKYPDGHQMCFKLSL